MSLTVRAHTEDAKLQKFAFSWSLSDISQEGDFEGLSVSAISNCLFLPLESVVFHTARKEF